MSIKSRWNHTLLYLTQLRGSVDQASAKRFIAEFEHQCPNPVLVLLDSDEEVKVLAQQDSEHCQYISVREEIRKTSLEEASLLSLRKSLFNKYCDIQPELFRDQARYLSFFRHLFLSFSINQGFLWSNGNYFRSLGGSLLDIVFKEQGVPFYMAHNTPVKGASMVYSDIAFTNDAVNARYLALLRNGISDEVDARISQYFESYARFKQANFYKRFERPKTAIDILNQYLPGGRRLVERQMLEDRHRPQVPQKPYLLFLLNKANNWLSNYALPFYTDVSYLAEVLWKALPTGHQLVVKDHPKTGMFHPERSRLLELEKKYPSFFYFSGGNDTEDLVDRAETIVCTCSTSGVEALTRGKKVVVFGSRPPFFTMQDPPVERIENVELLPDVLRKVLMSPVEKDKVIAYFEALLQESVPETEKDRFEVNENRDETYFSRVVTKMLNSTGPCNEKILVSGGDPN